MMGVLLDRIAAQRACLSVCGCRGTALAAHCAQDRWGCSECVPNAHTAGRVDTWAECGTPEPHTPEWVARARASRLVAKDYTA